MGGWSGWKLGCITMGDQAKAPSSLTTCTFIGTIGYLPQPIKLGGVELLHRQACVEPCWL